MSDITMFQQRAFLRIILQARISLTVQFFSLPQCYTDADLIVADRYKFNLNNRMCYEQSKPRLCFNTKSKPSQTHQPLIRDKKPLAQPRQKQNQKYNVDFHHKNNRNYNNNEFTSTIDYEPNKFNNTFLNAPYPHNNFANQERYTAHQNLQPHPAHVNTKTLTFGNVKTGANKVKQGTGYQQQPSFIPIPEGKKPLQATTKIINVACEKEKSSTVTERSEKPLIDRVADKKDKLIPKASVAKPPPCQLDDFTCTEQLEYKPVEKKSLIPQKKYNAQKTTSKFDFAKPKKPEKKDCLKQLKQFDTLEKSINTTSEGDSLLLFCQKQEEYLVDPGYLQKNQKTLQWWSRAIVVDWMRHISYEFALQRDTYHIAVVLLDNYLSKISNTPKSILQAIGATALFIASKLEQFQCKQSREFVKSTNNCCSVQDIHQLQIKMVKCLKFRLNPPTLYDLSNKAMSQWDLFLTENDYAKTHALFHTHPRAHFKQLDENSYRLFRELMQLIDCSVIDIQTAQYKPRTVVCSFMYLLLGRELGIFKSRDIVDEFPRSSLYLLDDENSFNDLFHYFLKNVFGLSLFEMLPVVQYCATYFELGFTYEKPMINEEENLETMSLEDYCSYQTFNNGMLKAIRNRYRGLY